MPLVDITVRNAKPVPGRIVKLSDTKGLQLWIMPTGSKLWNLAYRYDGKQKKLALGPYPAVGLETARAKRDAAKVLLAAGTDPSQQRKADALARADAKANTFGVVATELLAKKRREGKASSTIGKREWLYGLAGESFRERPLASIAAPEILAVLLAVQSRGLNETARRLRAAIGEVFRFGIATGRATLDPTFALRGALDMPVVTHRAAITDAKALGSLMRAIEGFQGQPTTVAALKLMALLFPRPGDMRLAEWREFDMANATWTIPASRTKMRREHVAPLPKQAVAILESLRAVTGHSDLVFPGLVSAKRPISENTLNLALRRMGYSQADMTAHGFRATASTLLNESGKWHADAIERALGHEEKSAVRRAYARGSHWKERVAMAQWWADHLDTLRDGAKVIAMVRA